MSSIEIDSDDNADDYYAFLNVPRRATAEEIRNAFKLMSKRYHPDKHTDPALKAAAESMFGRLKKCYDVLSDPRKRAIYDAVGPSGIVSDEMTLVERRFKSAYEIRQEYEQWRKESEERRLQQLTSPRGHTTILIDATDLFEHQYENEFILVETLRNEPNDDADSNGKNGESEIKTTSVGRSYIIEDSGNNGLCSIFYWPSVEIRSMIVSQSVESLLTTDDNLTLNGSLAVRNGDGVGTVSAALRHILTPKSWFEIEYGAGNGPLLGGKYFKAIRDDLQVLVQSYFHLTPYGIRPGFGLVLSQQIKKDLIAMVNIKTGGGDVSVHTMAVYENHLFRMNGSFCVGLRHSFISTSYMHKLPNDGRAKIGAKLGTLGLIVEYGCEAKVSQHTVMGAAISVGTHTGVSMVIKVMRNKQNYVFPVMLAEDILPSAIMFGTLIPLAAYVAAKTFIIDPYLRRREAETASTKAEENASKIAERRREAVAYRSLMRDVYTRIVERESQSAGLLIERAIYGDADVVMNYSEYDHPIPDITDAFDVTLAVQVMTDNSNLVFTESSKSYLPGFFDSCIGRPKKLLIRYRFRNANHQVILEEKEAARLPCNQHRIQYGM
ncbi:hypothetical protein RDWZM_001104 [Blomia tropicalis]|uniref:J domain-containing protein n=1 Tax=Blomia tropicalis TaxID=40697 RepID=A0A9Q0MBT7_BLOTA|nr:DnaJ (Hsp40), sub C, member 11 [Blomia tropicalis]KAJ6222559.1 hypothetical protein RDWZM_001104 [Blomia tropicalis]